MLKAILASKLYKTSNRKRAIHSAYNSPVNKELVQQLEQYISDEDYEKLHPKENVADTASDVSDESSQTTVKPSESSGGGSAPSEGSFSSLGDDVPGMVVDDSGDSSNANFGSDPDEGGNVSDVSTDSPEDVDIDNNVEESTKIFSFTTLDDAIEYSQIIKNQLNSVDATSGVSRVCVKDCELWVYYNDNVNLNNVMTAVIDSLNAQGYNYLDFSRLARSDNAVVFDIHAQQHEMNPDSGESDEKKEES